LGETGVAGRPEEYFEALRHSGRPRRPEEYFLRVEDPSIRDHLGERAVGSEPPPRSPLWSRAAYDRYLEWAFEVGTTDNGVFGAKLMWGYFGDFISLLRNVPAYRDLSLAELLPAVFPDVTFVRVVRANKLRQAVSLWKAVQTATWREDQASAKAASVEDDGSPPYRTFIEEHRPQLRFHYRAIAHLLDQLLVEEASWDAFFEHCGIRPVLVLYENFAADYETSTLNLLDRLSLAPPEGFEFEPRMKRQSDRINDDWVRRFSELRLGTDFDLVPASALAEKR
jgi:LPS sulfotransferase NodH